MNLLIVGSFLVAAPGLGRGADPQPPIALADLRDVELGGAPGEALARGIARLAQAPYMVDWLLADVSFGMERIFTNYSGDASGRFIELAALASPRGDPSPAALAPILAAIAKYQKPDGHFGVDVDLSKPLVKGAAPIPMLWGNARLLVGLVTAARETGDTKLLAAARRLGEFYVASAAELRSSAREAEFRATGTYGDGYTCCYFPAIESLALLYQATKDPRYLDQARRMAAFFEKFDVLPVDHSHGNLCAWRGILMLHELTGERAYLDRARAKWDAAVEGGYVWPIGGVGEHWAIFHPGDEGCSESDWLRFNLDLWRFTGETRYLDMAERLLENQYLGNQCANGGFGWRNFEGDAAGPISTRGTVDEWAFCCSFHGPLGLHFLKAYLAAGSDRALSITFPIAFRARVRACGRTWRINSAPVPARGSRTIDIDLAPEGDPPRARAALRIRVPSWATSADAEIAGLSTEAARDGNWLVIEREFAAGDRIRVRFGEGIAIEGRRFRPIRPEPGRIGRLRDITLLSGPHALFALPSPRAGRPTLLAMIDAEGRVRLPAESDGAFVTVSLPSADAGDAEIASAIASAPAVRLVPEAQIRTRRRAAFAFDLVLAPAGTLPAGALASLAERARKAEEAIAGPFFGEDLETRSDIWIGAGGWEFAAGELRVSGGEVGLIDGEGYADYRFEFDLTLPPDGFGITGWVVRAASESDCLMFQFQTADSPYDAPEFKTRPNTLPPHIRRGGAWTIADPIPLPKEIRRGETHHIATECRGDRIEVFLDGTRIHAQGDSGYRTGAVGFRAGGAGERGIFRKITLLRR